MNDLNYKEIIPMQQLSDLIANLTYCEEEESKTIVITSGSQSKNVIREINTLNDNKEIEAYVYNVIVFCKERNCHKKLMIEQPDVIAGVVSKLPALLEVLRQVYETYENDSKFKNQSIN